MSALNTFQLVQARYACVLCGDVIESRGTLVYCQCKAVGIDARPGETHLRLIGERRNCRSLCVWRDSETGEQVFDADQ